MDIRVNISISAATKKKFQQKVTDQYRSRWIRAAIDRMPDEVMESLEVPWKGNVKADMDLLALMLSKAQLKRLDSAATKLRASRSALLEEIIKYGLKEKWTYDV